MPTPYLKLSHELLFTAKDGTPLPVTLLHRPDLRPDGLNSLLL